MNDSNGALFWLAGAALAWHMWRKMKLLDQSRGLRINNPLNIRENQRVDYDWEGEAWADTDKEFEEFTDPRYGYRAGKRIIDSYRRRGVMTLESIIATWAPAEDNNDPEAYAAAVATWTGMRRDEVVTDELLPTLFAAMTRMEQGVNPYSREFILEGIRLA